MTQRYGGRSKYGNKKIVVNGVTYDSKLEYALWSILCARQASGELAEVKHHPGTIFLSDARIQTRPDFSFVRRETKELEWAEAKGEETPVWRIKRKLWMHYGSGKLWIYMGTYKKIFLKEMIETKK